MMTTTAPVMMPKLQRPIVLVHGLFGFDRFSFSGYTLAEYFPGITEAMRRAGNRVGVPYLSPTAGIRARAEELRDFLHREFHGERAHLLAHSMGGLDARYMITRLNMAEAVFSLTTIGTPHQGTAFADWGVKRLERVVRPVFDFLDIPSKAFYDLTPSACAEFNEVTPDIAGVRYLSVGGRHDGSLYSPEWLLPYHIVLEREGANDGVVSLSSARYGEYFEIWDADHLKLVNWQSPWQPGPTVLGRYAHILSRLAMMELAGRQDDAPLQSR